MQTGFHTVLPSYRLLQVCYNKGNPFNWGREIWENKGVRAKEEAFKC